MAITSIHYYNQWSGSCSWPLQWRGWFHIHAPSMQAQRKRRREKRKATDEVVNGTLDVRPRCDAQTAHFEEKSKVVEDEVVVQLGSSQSSVSARQHLVVVFYMLCKCSIYCNACAGCQHACKCGNQPSWLWCGEQGKSVCWRIFPERGNKPFLEGIICTLLLYTCMKFSKHSLKVGYPCWRMTEGAPSSLYYGF